MIQLSTTHAQAASDVALPALNTYTAHLQKVVAEGGYNAVEGSLNLSKDAALITEVKALAEQKTSPSLKYNIVVGIGGSNLGTKAVYDAILGFRDTMSPEGEEYPKLLFAETTDPEWLLGIEHLIENLQSPDEILVTVISKSGGTTETLANFEIIAAALTSKIGDVHERIVAITDEGSKLWDAAGAKNIARLSLPKQVGGRYSVLSAVGLFPLQTVHIDIAQLQQGAAQMLDSCLGDGGQNIAAESAQTLAAHLQKGYTINDNFFFHPELESLGKWYRQLMGESVGKAQSLTGETVHTGITPTVSLGSTDLHSVGQLYLGGPKDKLTTFVSAPNKNVRVPVPENRIFPDLVPVINGKTAEDIMQAILNGVQIAYQKANLPYMHVTLDKIDEASLGAFLQFKMLEMMYLGQLLNVNSFDQPNVEDYKVETKRLLEQ
jgi:glucose-6-phosphate isomerase